MRFFSKERWSGAFTLLELLVATAITSLLIVVLVTLGMATLDAWGGARSFVRYQSSARAALDLMDSDLRSMLSRGRLPGEAAGAAPWLEVKGDGSGGAGANSLSFFSRVTDLEAGWEGDLVAVRCELIEQDPARPGGGDSEGNIRALYRAVASPESTVEGALEASDLDTEFWAGQEVGDPVNLLAANVAVMSVEFWVRGNDGVRRRADWGAGGWLRVGRNLEVSWQDADAGGAPYRLAGIDVGVEVVSDTGMVRLQDGVALADVPAAERRVFSQFVPVLPER